MRAPLPARGMDPPPPRARTKSPPRKGALETEAIHSAGTRGAALSSASALWT
ncbi:MAG TPA: hypothetical protein VK459_20250 [Polyangiaceae bacterium]|nr:hypothetical protein [Polyangiaceae bacterium]